MPQFQHLASKCDFPWLLANVTDPALGQDVPLGNAEKMKLLTASNGIKVGLIGIVEREWLDTINSLPPDIVYKSATATVKDLGKHECAFSSTLEQIQVTTPSGYSTKT